MDTSFEDEDIFNQYDLRKLSPTKTAESTITDSSNLRQSVSRTEILDILTIVESTLDKAWAVSCRGQKRRLQKLETLRELKEKLNACPNDMNLSMVMEHAMAPTSCIPPLFGRDPNRIVEQQLSSTLEFLNEHLNAGGDESDNATIGGSFAENDEELEMMSAYSHFSSDSSASSVFTHSNYDADSETGMESDGDAGLSEDSEEDDVVVTTCNVENDICPLDVSITTWSRRKLNGDSIRSRMTASLVADAEGTDVSNVENDDEQNEDAGQETIEEVQVSIGKLVVHASRSRSVRFSGIKPSTDDNISRAMELLKNAKMMRARMSGESSSDE